MRRVFETGIRCEVDPQAIVADQPVGGPGAPEIGELEKSIIVDSNNLVGEGELRRGPEQLLEERARVSGVRVERGQGILEADRYRPSAGDQKRIWDAYCPREAGRDLDGDERWYGLVQPLAKERELAVSRRVRGGGREE